MEDLSIMRIFLLLILPLMTGCEDDVKGCTDGWVDFKCRYQSNNDIYTPVDVVKGGQTVIQSTQGNVWENNSRFSVFHDTNKRNLRVIIKELQREDSGDYKCLQPRQRGRRSDEEEEVDLKVVDKNCQRRFILTAYRTAKTTVSCDGSRIKFFCKDNGSICEDILKSSQKSNGTFTLTKTRRGFNISISDVSSQHAGDYWCGQKTKNGKNRASLRRIQVKVEDIRNFTKSAVIGENLTYWCLHQENTNATRFICRGEDPSLCEHLVNTTQSSSNRFTMKDDSKGNITVTVRDITTEDTGTYWCGAESTDQTLSNTFYHRLTLSVAPPNTSPPSVSSSTSPHPVTSSSSTQCMDASAGRHGGSWLNVIIPVVVCVVLLVLLLVVVLGYKRFRRLNNTRNEDQNNEDRAYEEIEERPQEPGSGPALQTLYVTANAPTNPSASQCYSTVNFPNAPGNSTVTDTDRCPAYSTVNHPSRLPEEPFYSTVNNPQQL